MTDVEAFAFRNRFLGAVSAKLGLSYEEFVRSQGWSTYDDDRMRKARSLIYRGAGARALGYSGWKRKLKRARRIQRIVCGAETSNAWFSMQWQNAVAFARRYEAAPWSDGIYRALMTPDGRIVAFAPPRRKLFDIEGWKRERGERLVSDYMSARLGECFNADDDS